MMVYVGHLKIGRMGCVGVMEFEGEEEGGEGWGRGRFRVLRLGGRGGIGWDGGKGER